MQDEVMKHSRKIIKTLKKKQSPFADKVKDILVEIFIIVFAVTLSIWLHSWSQHHHQQAETIEFLSDLKDDLTKDIEGMNEKKEQMINVAKDYTYLRNLTEQRIDSLTAKQQPLGLTLNFVIRKTNVGNYEGFKSSGKIGYIENKKLKKLILEYYQESMPSIEETEKYYNTRIAKIEDLVYQDKDKKEKFLDPVLKTSLDFVIHTAKNNQRNYESIAKEAQAIIDEIDKEVNN